MLFKGTLEKHFFFFFLNGEWILLYIDGESTKDVPVHASTPRRTSGSFLIQQRGPAKPVHVQIVQIGIRRCIICTPRTVNSAVHHRRCIICTPRTVNSAVHHNTTDCQLGGASYVHHRWTPRTVNSAVHHMHTTEKRPRMYRFMRALPAEAVAVS
jgi:hypothetical protein